ncbi:MAG: iron-sulfur cluster assembly accessory protein [Anaerolineales bacterium]|nr:iron-sulfur cluster assembly accessory protein [Anaerolineales bacterium]MCX7609082.1 iron-sulfur cluster assembly accessory protein [Anaerolineales bacterium]MDW8226829.1 iron-sulfur cluster assembly accessory protein [Anaerolineales bacterium]
MTTPTSLQAVTLTPSAAEMIRQLIKERKLDDSFAFRIYIAGRTCSGFRYGLALDNHPLENDSVFESEGVKILIDEDSLQYLSGSVIDYIDDERGQGFLVDNPYQLPSCSCENGSCGC